MRKHIFILLCSLLVLFTCMPSSVAGASSGLKLKYDGKSMVYKDKRVKYKLDGKTLKLNKTPGIIINGYSLVSYKEIFQSGIGASCKYDASSGAVTITKFDKTVKLTLGSRTAYINGVKTTAPIAPRKVTYVAQKTTKVLVPARFVAEALGYTYQWYPSQSQVAITSPYQIFYDGAWHLYTDVKCNVSIDGRITDTQGNPGVVIDDTVLVFAKKVFESKEAGVSYTYEPSTKKVTLTRDSTTIEFTLDSKKVVVNGIEQELDTAPRIIKNNESKKSVIMVPAAFTASTLGYEYNWNSNSQIAEINTKGTNSEKPELTENVIQLWEGDINEIAEGYTNQIVNLALLEKGSSKILRLEGKVPVFAAIETDPDNPNKILFQFPGMQNTIGDINYTLEGNPTFIKEVTVISEDTFSTTIQIEKSDSAEYYAQASGNCYEIVFSEPVSSSDYALRMRLPVQVGFSEVTDEDEYFKNQFILTLPGDQTDFYEANPIEILKNNIKKVSCSLNGNGDTEVTVQTKTLQGYKLVEENGFICIEVANPSEIYDKIVLLDPGHGKEAVGTISSSGMYEKNATLAILYTYIKPYFTDKASSVKAYWTRTGDDNPGLYERADMAAETQADIFISLHMNSGPSSAKGTETYYSKNNNKTSFSGLTSQKLATHFQDSLPEMLGLSGSRGVKTNTFVVIHKNTVPAILIELGFFSNPSDFKKLSDPAFQKRAAESIYDLIEQLFEEYPTGR